MLNPFAFPSETLGRFRLLAVAALVFSWSLSTWVIYVPNLYTQQNRVGPEIREILEEISRNPLSFKITREHLRKIKDSPDTRKIIQISFWQTARILLALSMTTAFLVFVWGLYVIHPWRIRRRLKVEPMESPSAREEIRRLADHVGLSHEFTVGRKPGFLDGVAFGRKGREVLAMADSNGLVSKYPWNDMIRAVALHELGHIVNGDIRTREISRSAWVALLILLVIVVGAILGASIDSGRLAFPILHSSDFIVEGEAISSTEPKMIFLRTILLLAAVQLLWIELIRIREFYADQRVVAWGFMKPLISRLKARERRGLRFHPSNAERLNMIENPHALFEASPRLAFLAGLVWTLVIGQMIPLGMDLIFVVIVLTGPVFFLVGPLSLLLPIGLAALLTVVLTHLVSSALGVQIQRQALADLVDRPHHEWGYLRIGRIAFYFTLGFEAGLAISPFNSLMFSRSPVWAIFWSMTFCGLIWAWSVSLRAMARLVLGSQRGMRGAGSTQRVLSLFSTFILSALVWPALILRFVVEISSRQELLEALTPIGSDPQEFLGMCLVSAAFSFFASILFYILLNFFGLAFSCLRFLKTMQCDDCGSPYRMQIAAGRQCEACRSVFAKWLYMKGTS